jgi:hypothetical protein
MVTIGEPISPELVLVDPDLRSRVLAAESQEPEPKPGRRRPRIPSGVATLAVFALAGIAIGVAHALVGERRPVLAPLHSAPRPHRMVEPRKPAIHQPHRTARKGPHSHHAARKRSHHRRQVRRVEHHRARAHRIVREIEPATELLGPLPDPTPPDLRLRPTVARALVAASLRYRVDWPVLLAAARARGLAWTRVTPAQLRALARRLRHERAHHVQPPPEEVALARYDDSIGLDTLVSGLGSARAVLSARVLRDPRIAIYPGGRADVAAGRVDVRVLALLLYLARAEGSVAVSSLVTGHEGPEAVRSVHDLGLAVDLRAIGGKPVLGNQTVPGPVERAIREMMLLPREVRPLQIVSLLSLGGPSLALADHDRLVDVGFDPTVGQGLDFLWRTAGVAYGVPWTVLAAINEIETKNGTFLKVSPAGAVGWMQFMPGTWQRYGFDADGNGAADPWNPADAIFSAARYLSASGAANDLPRAIWAYNHARWYVDDVLARSQRIAEESG